MRLQLSIQRHALPTINILWTVRARDPPSSSAHASATISQLLEDVNDIVQLESEDWGLEDYVVQVGGYECLHFQPIQSVLKEDDEVVIRALQTTDLRIRRIGGRHQISADGRHLFDGVAFGRPYLRKTTRPAFRIPPRKRRKLDVGTGQYIEDDAFVEALLPAPTSVDRHAENESSLQLVTSQHFEDADQVSAGEEEKEDDDSDFNSDLQSFTEEEGGDGDLDLSEELKALLEDDPTEKGDIDDGEKDEGRLTQSDELNNDAIRRHKKRKWSSDVESADRSMRATNGSKSPTITGSGTSFGAKVDSIKIPSRSFDVFNGFRAFGGKSSFVEDTSAPVASSESENKAGSSDISSCSSSSSSLSESGIRSESESESDSDSKSESESDSEFELKIQSESQTKSVAEKEIEATTASFPSVRNTTGQVEKTSSTVTTHSRSAQSAPGKGLKRTRKNNQRAKRRKRLNTLKAAGRLAPEAGFKELSNFELVRAQTPIVHDSRQQESLDDIFQARKQELLEQRTGSEVDATHKSDTHGNISQRVSQGSTNETSTILAQPLAAAPRKRARLDIASSRRMVFGSLGLKNPTTPAAEQELRKRLANKPSTVSKGRENVADNDSGDDSQRIAEPASPGIEAEFWRDKIILSAVECEAGGQAPSTPPFPFFQRWQEAEGKKQVEDPVDHYHHPDMERLRGASDGLGGLDRNAANRNSDPILSDVRLKGDFQTEVLEEAQEPSTQQGVIGSMETDLPLINDLNAFGALKAEDAKSGTVIAFKCLEMSKATNWQPEISSYRMARIQEALGDGTLKIQLAERDRASMSSIVDGQTGERVFEKFEMPIEHEEECQDNGIREVSYHELVEPKLIEQTVMIPSGPEMSKGANTSTSRLTLAMEIPEVDQPTRLADATAGQSSTEVTTSIYRQKDMSTLVKDADFHSALVPEIPHHKENVPESAPRDMESSQASSLAFEKPSSIPSMNMDGAATELEPASLNSPLFAGSRSSSFHGNNSRDTSNGLIQKDNYPGTERSCEDKGSGYKKNISYPRISQLIIHEHSTTILNEKRQAIDERNASPIENGKPDHDSVMVTTNNASVIGHEESYFDSLKTTIPPSEDAELQSGPSSTSSSRITNPCYTGHKDNASSDDDLPSLSEITSTARSRWVSPPPMKNVATSRRNKCTGPELAPGASEQTLLKPQAQKETSSSTQPFEIPPGSQVVDLAFSSDPTSPDRSDKEPGPSQRSSLRIKQSDDQIKAKESLSRASARTGNRRLVRGSLGRPKQWDS